MMGAARYNLVDCTKAVQLLREYDFKNRNLVPRVVPFSLLLSFGHAKESKKGK